jgi:lipoprotein NlpI
MRLALGVLALAWLSWPAALESRRQSPQDLVEKAEADFAQNKIAESVADYDRLIVLVPSIAPVLWQRGIGLYELGRFKECAAQFAAHATVEPVDMENAAWHFFCTARADTARTRPRSPERRCSGRARIAGSCARKSSRW